MCVCECCLTALGVANVFSQTGQRWRDDDDNCGGVDADESPPISVDVRRGSSSSSAAVESGSDVTSFDSRFGSNLDVFCGIYIYIYIYIYKAYNKN